MEAELWAKLACARILEGTVCQVVKGLRQTFTKQGLFGSKRKTLTEVAAYFDNNKHRMRHDEYLAPENKRVWASLTEGKEAVMQEVLEEIQRRDPNTKKTRAALTDGERALQKLVDKKLRVFNTQGGPA